MFRALKSERDYIGVLLLISALLLGFLAFVVRYQNQYGVTNAMAFCTYAAMAALLIVILTAVYTVYFDSYRRSRELFSLVFEGLKEGVYDYDVLSGSVYYSPSYYQMLGYTQAELSSSHANFFWLIHPEDRASALEVLNGYFERRDPRENFYNTFRVQHKDGHWIWVMSRGMGVWGKDGKIHRLVGTHTDISIQKQREEELSYFMRENERQREELASAKEKAEAANHAKSDFLAAMSHEIRTPMNVVVGLSSMLMRMKLDEKQTEMVNTLHANADILLRLVNDLLDLSRIEARQITLETCAFTFEDIFTKLGGIFGEQATRKKLDFVIESAIGDQFFIGDAIRVQQILINLIGNAMKFTAQGRVAVKADYEPLPKGQAEVRITVSDTGIGIAEEKLTAIFDRFVQADQSVARRYGGSGLGLAISKSLAELMGGKIEVSTHVGQGSAFTVSLPLELGKVQKLVPAQAAPDNIHAANSASTVLVVEDYAANVMVVSMMLEMLGYKVDVARTGTEAVEKVEKRTAPYAAILMDVRLQDTDGFEVTKRIRALEKTKNFRHYIVGVTAHALARDRDRCLESGMNEYMSKPINIDRLSQMLSQQQQRVEAA